MAGARLAIKSDIFLTKSEIIAIHIPIGIIFSGASWPGDGRPWLFDKLAQPQPGGKFGAKEFFLVFSAVTL